MTLDRLRVELKEFCQQFSTSLKPFSRSLDDTLQALRDVKADEGVQPVLDELLENRHRLKILQDKAHQQHAYLVIFGPLKSGKSTLMNAISGSYVSEVTSLPAYPCLVYVHEGDEHRIATTTFNGDEATFPSARNLNEHVQAAHEELAERIRQADESNLSFNPAQDYKEAIRRIDFTLPAPYLRESGTILVDTPGLYAKMRYNYGQLTRDFRDTAACAVFVVKTDNLFFERVFEEFADLLEVFSRVFLVVNIDSTKQDLGPDGELQPSLERENPRKIIETFENLTVSAQIRSAIHDGRLRIYAIDLLHTAQQSLQGQQDGESATDGEAIAVDEESGMEDTPEEPLQEEETDAGQTGRIGFPAFLKDLTDYLNSSDYLVEFMADSLRQTSSILRETGEQSRSSRMQTFRDGIEALRETSGRLDAQLSEVRQLREDSWDGPMDELTREIRQQINEHAGSILPELKESAQTEVDAWLETDGSLQSLLEYRLQPLIRKACHESRQRARGLIDGACATRNSGLRLSAGLVGRIHGIGLQFDDIYPQFQPRVGETFSEEFELPDPETIHDPLPLRKTFLDYLLFRSPAKIQKLVFGDEVPSTKDVPAAVKTKRFGEAAVSALHDSVTAYIETTFREQLEEPADNLLEAYRKLFHEQASERLKSKADELEKEARQARKRLESRRLVAEAMDSLDANSRTLAEEMGNLYDTFVKGKLSPEAAILGLDPDALEEDGEAQAAGEYADGDAVAESWAADDVADTLEPTGEEETGAEESGEEPRPSS
ncbi:MAG TPA: GTPase domain-containing protein [Oceanipulchritudo sp.]|nr:GTPase domain-containing protein [Oceanipulchritudo sp.]